MYPTQIRVTVTYPEAGLGVMSTGECQTQPKIRTSWVHHQHDCGGDQMPCHSDILRRTKPLQRSDREQGLLSKCGGMLTCLWDIVEWWKEQFDQPSFRRYPHLTLIQGGSAINFWFFAICVTEVSMVVRNFQWQVGLSRILNYNWLLDYTVLYMYCAKVLGKYKGLL